MGIPMTAYMWGASALVLATALAVAQPAAAADPATPAAKAATDSAATTDTAATDANLDQLIVTGTRQTGLKASDSAAPVEILDAGILARTGRPDLIQALSQNLPSFTAQGFGGNESNLKLSARLRGLSANHALILVNGKRRHGASNLTVSSTGGYSGAAAADLTFISSGSIDHIEILQDGAAAQYGSDAIAGVINIILKEGNGGSISATGGRYFAGDGDTGGLTANWGWHGQNKAFVNVTGEYRDHSYSDRGGPDRRVYTSANLANPALPLLPGYPYLNHIFGDAHYNLFLASYNAGFGLGDNAEFYSFGSYGRRNAGSQQNYRFPSISPALWPQGFTPVIAHTENDLSFTGGLKGKLSTWDWDLSSTYGSDDNALDVLNAVNTSLVTDTGTSPRDFHVGDFIATQWTNNLDFRRGFDVGAATPLDVAFGLEQRNDSFELKAGDAASRYKTGAAAYPGFSLTDAGKHKRNNVGAYVDLALSPVEKWKVDLAGRFEHFSDFGNASVFKLTSRYDFTPTFAIRGTASTGFRAPTLAEEYYSATTVSPTTAGVRLPPNNAAAQLLGIDPLKPEKSTNFSLGLVAHPAPKLTATLDVYQIDIDNRIVSTGTIYGKQNNVLRSQAVTDAIIANGNILDASVVSTSISAFINGVDTTTKGAELVVTYASDFGGRGSIDWSLGANYNTNKVTRIAPASAQIAASGQAYLDKAAVSLLETASPKYKITLGSLYKNGKWAINLRNTLYGKSSTLVDGAGANNYLENVVSSKVITDLDIAYKITDAIKISVGADNLFDIRPDAINPLTYAASLTVGGNGTATTSSFGPYGINGGYFYSRIAYTF
jgi:iron complex outermembrane receptor protein